MKPPPHTPLPNIHKWFHLMNRNGWTNTNVDQSHVVPNIITQWHSTFGFAYIHTTLLYSSLFCLFQHCLSPISHTHHQFSQLFFTLRKWQPTHWWALLSQPSLLYFLPQNQGLPLQFPFPALAPMPLLGFPWLLTGCLANLDPLTLMVQHQGMPHILPFFFSTIFLTSNMFCVLKTLFFCCWTTLLLWTVLDEYSLVSQSLQKLVFSIWKYRVDSLNLLFRN